MLRDFSFLPASPVALTEGIRQAEKNLGVKVIRFDVAEPYFDPPKTAVEATVKAVRKGYTHYAPTKGLSELRIAVAEFFQETRNLSYAENEIIITPGAKFSIYAFLACIVEANAEVILLAPFWSSFKADVILFGGKPVEVSTVEPYHIDEEKLKNAVTQRTRAIIINTPNNPTGGVLSESELKVIADLAEDHNLFVLCDEVDWAYVYDGRRHVSLASIEKARDRTLVVDSFSKVFAMTGWRIGFAAGPEILIERLNTIQQHSVTGPATFIQKACVDVLKNVKPYVKKIVNETDRKRKFIMKKLDEIPGVKYSRPEGAFYIYPNARSYGLESDDLAYKMLNEAGVAVTSGSLFSNGKYRFRMCYALPTEDLRVGTARMKRFFNKLEKKKN